LVEASQRLLRAIDDLLNRELGRAALVDQRERRIQQPLNALLGAGARRAQAFRDCALTPTGSVLVVHFIGSRHWMSPLLRHRFLPSPPGSLGGICILAE